jgi:hypothetical protein
MVKKGAVTSGCNAGPARVGRRRHGRCRSAYVKSDLHGVGFLAVEGAPAFGKALPFAGRRRNEGLGRHMRTRGIIQPSGRTVDDETRRGARVAQMRRGIFAHVVLRQQAAGGKILRSELLGPCSPALSSNGRRRKRWSGRGVARKRRRDRSVTFGVVLYGVLAAPWGRFRKDCRGSQLS